MEKNYWRSRIVNGEEFTPAEQAELDRDVHAACGHTGIMGGPGGYYDAPGKSKPCSCTDHEEDAF